MGLSKNNKQVLVLVSKLKIIFVLFEHVLPQNIAKNPATIYFCELEHFIAILPSGSFANPSLRKNKRIDKDSTCLELGADGFL